MSSPDIYLLQTVRRAFLQRPGLSGADLRSVSLPVYAIGGIALGAGSDQKTLAAGARGVCIMSGAMKFSRKGSGRRILQCFSYC